MSELPLRRALYLDDKRTPTLTIPGYEPWQVVRSYDEFVKWIDNNPMADLISFDHDLHDEHYVDYVNYQSKGILAINYNDFQEKTGFDCAKYLCELILENKADIPRLMCCHSQNPLGRTNILAMLNGFKRHLNLVPDCFEMNHPFTIEMGRELV